MQPHIHVFMYLCENNILFNLNSPIFDLRSVKRIKNFIVNENKVKKNFGRFNRFSMDDVITGLLAVNFLMQMTMKVVHSLNFHCKLSIEFQLA